MKRQEITVAVNSQYKRHIRSQNMMTIKKTREVLRFVEELVSLVLCVTQSNSGQTARPHILVLVSLCDSETESYYFTQYFLLILFKILPFSSMPALSFAVSCCISQFLGFNLLRVPCVCKSIIQVKVAGLAQAYSLICIERCKQFWYPSNNVCLQEQRWEHCCRCHLSMLSVE